MYFVLNGMGVHWRLNKGLILWLGLFVLIGIVIGIIIVANPRVMPEMISERLLDVNVLRVVRPNTTFGGVIIGRFLLFALFCLGVFLLSLSKWTVWIIYVFAIYRGFVTVINLYWIIATFGLVMGMALFLVYMVLFLILIFIHIIVMMICIRECSWVRRGGMRGSLRWKDWQRFVICFAIMIVVFAIVEFLMYWLILGRFVYIVPPPLV